MFFSRSQNSPSAQSLIGSDSTNVRPALEQALAGSRKPDEKVNVIGELVDMKVDSPTRVDFSSQVYIVFGLGFFVFIIYY